MNFRNPHSELIGIDSRGETHPRVRVCVKTPVLATLCCVVLFGLAASQGQSASEDEVKSAYLYNFTHSAQWPTASLPADKAPFVIGVVGGEARFVDRLRTTVDGRTIGSHPVMAKAVVAEAEIRACQIVFFRYTETRRVPAVIASLHSAPVLLVGEDPSFLGQGGMINLFLQNGKIRFEVNRQNLDRAAIRLSPALLQLAKANDGSLNNATAGGRQLRVSAPPPYPELARRLNIRGLVRLDVVVRRDGTVKQVKVHGGNPVLADALSDAVRNWRYEPAPQETVEDVEYTFTP
jgi:TonB family protein